MTKKSGEITVCFVNDKKIKELNLRYLQKNEPTDVLAFDSGDIVVSTDAAIRNAKIFETERLYELYLYIIHGVLHLSGYDDKTPKLKKKMDKKTKEIFKKCGSFNADLRRSNADQRR
ncbi:MAG: rRNA maturation RNase YbeY [Candidatus Omnitrophota bacterium]